MPRYSSEDLALLASVLDGAGCPQAARVVSAAIERKFDLDYVVNVYESYSRYGTHKVLSERDRFALIAFRHLVAEVTGTAPRALSSSIFDEAGGAA